MSNERSNMQNVAFMVVMVGFFALLATMMLADTYKQTHQCECEAAEVSP